MKYRNWASPWRIFPSENLRLPPVKARWLLLGFSLGIPRWYHIKYSKGPVHVKLNRQMQVKLLTSRFLQYLLTQNIKAPIKDNLIRFRCGLQNLRTRLYCKEMDQNKSPLVNMIQSWIMEDRTLIFYIA